jgi:predicted nucleic acid-binding Zn ribbon protein
MKAINQTLSTQWLKKARLNLRLNQALSVNLPSEIARSTQVIGLDSGILKLACDAPVWATRLRFMEPQLKRQLNAAGIECLGIRTRVLPANRSGRKPNIVRRPDMSQARGNAIHAMAKDTNDSELGAALRRLAQRGRGKSD